MDISLMRNGAVTPGLDTEGGGHFLLGWGGRKTRER